MPEGGLHTIMVRNKVVSGVYDYGAEYEREGVCDYGAERSGLGCRAALAITMRNGMVGEPRTITVRSGVQGSVHLPDC